uniref:NADH-ubiquinone oxidoreductase chain 3 n=1 Tax=Ciona savignyi TaxID=51511 RepID=Q85UH3_CIOSA|nr:NADH dehydrogenase subunit 3 [Ciona savignyi]BAC57010.1 NADH dehydrogenase subunit 3 [Ciona savignyi]
MFFMVLFMVSFSLLLLYLGSITLKGFVLNIFNSSFSAYECGFTTMGNYKNFYTMQFFIIGLSFMLFDLEILLFLPFMKSECLSFFSLYLSLFFIFMVTYLLSIWIISESYKSLMN